jgi:2-amino-4-hydroxy-6-hydroxymethyldihydropteridine diphosphokinase
MTTISYIGIGSNVGDRQGFVNSSVAALDATEGVVVDRVSSLYETSPVGGPPQRSFINAVARIETILTARALREVCKGIERALGRGEPTIRWGPRVVDLDLLLFGDEKVNEPDLEIPHPRMRERRFVLVPLLELDPEVTDPWGGRFGDWVDDAVGEVRRI